ncbi:hypothetical protein AOL_s00097g191 [Orbilia oligospora ATCC 24927]|uniref:HORMA domain-containing protein n=2 Tax=Orbilia oligospora TaxID=2813651 RepID=G1XIL4_ARTOA|nr:hypothetical protein AOL_s00097g191 [Orbilia oligospora ATCC 24927]EGX47145.1 hypothetical protein AOL_s00097g191 [Orbilia oligospora ATCC 24927]KAF3273499.1 hypothetical protein TWF970_009020 [Orbilia oligospora]
MPPMDTYANLITSFTDLLLVSIHTILYEREIYPSTLFIPARKYNHPVRQARHPLVCQWIQEAVDACAEELMKCTVDLIAVNIISSTNKPLERFVFDVSRFPVIATTDIHSPFVVTDEDGNERGSGTLADLEEHMRAVITKLSYSTRKLRKLPKGCTFSVSVELKNEATAPEGNPPVWIAAEYQEDDTPLGRRGTALKTRDTNRTIPVRSLVMGALALETWIEEAEGNKDMATDEN